jgi:tetratricopeptide (TPR) repeat protein
MRICHRLDGLPLAIELAAARMKMFSPQQLLVRLESGFGVLAQGPRDAPARQRTLHATIDWSYHLLDDDEKRLFVRLSISPGGWSLDAFDAICVDGLAVDPFDALSSLLDKSLIQQASGDHTEPRFFMLATLREYALEHLNPEDATALYRRYCDWFTAFAEQAYSGLHSSTSLRWYENLLLEEDNLRAALTLSLTPPRYPTLGLQLAGALSEFWHTRGRYREGTTWLTRALDVASCAPSYARARALNGAGLMAWRQGHYEEMAAWCTEALTIGEQIGDDCIRGFALHYLGHFEQLRQDYPRAVAFMTEGYRLYTETCSDAWGRAQALNCLGDLQRQLGVYADAEALLNQALPLFRKMNHQRGTMTVLGNLGHVLCHLEQPGESAARLSEALGIAQQLNSDAHIVELLPGFAGFALTVGVVARSAQLLGAVHSLSPSIGIVLQPVEQTDFDLYLAQARDRLDQQTFAAAWEAGEKMSLQQVIKFAMQTIAIWSEANVP